MKNLKGAKTLSKKEQKEINGGKARCLYSQTGPPYCTNGQVCVNGICEDHLPFPDFPY